MAVFVALYRTAELKRRAAELEAGNRRLEADLAENRRLAVQLAHQASHDNLTGLPNRPLFDEILRETLALSWRSGHRAAVAFVDLDRFKFINDTFGHAAGDDVLKEAARRLTCAIRASDIVARIGGDEFVVVLTEFAEWQESVLVAEKMLRVVARPFMVGGVEVSVSAIIGIAVFPDDGDDGMTLLKRADVAMYQAKQAGGNCFRFCTSEMSAVAAQRLARENDLRTALESEEFLLHFEAAQLEPLMIEFEVTEHASIFQNAESLTNLRRLRELGCKIALDDFGTGQSGLALLRQFRFDSLKLAPLFVADLPGNEPTAAIAEAIIGLARRLGLRAVALGVSNAEQVRLLKRLGCDQIQGEWISTPVPADECAALIRGRQASQANSHRNPAT